MRLFKKNELKEAIDDRIADLGYSGDVDADREKIDNIKELVEIKEKLEGPKKSIDKNVVINCIVTVGVTLMIIFHEQTGVITSKAFGLVQRRM